MTHKRTLALVAAALVALAALTGVVAAAPGNGSGNADGTNSDDDRRAGPPGDLPGPVPDFVEELHAQIRAFLDGGLDHLGAAVSATAGGESGDDDAR